MSGDKNKDQKVADIRRDYAREELVESSVEDNPIDQFVIWFEQAVSSNMLDPNAMTLSTATRNGVPSSRIVLLKRVEKQGFRFYTNYSSRKGEELEENPRAALCFYWPSLERQVRVQGIVEKLSEEESETYFQQRPRSSKIGAWASKQSSRVSSRAELEEKFEEIKRKYKNKEVPLPEFWGGYILKPNRIEFWQGRKSRMHDRICYEKDGEKWVIFRLSP